MKVSPARRARLFGLTACLAVTLAACGSSSKSSSPSPTTGASNSAAGSTGGSPTTSGSPGTSSSGSGDANIDACSLLTAAKLSSLAGHAYSDPMSQTIATGQDQCSYKNSAPSVDLTVIVYQPNSGVSFDSLKSIQSAPTDVAGVGDKAIAGDIELDIQVGDRLVAIEGAPGGGNGSVSVAIGKAIVAALG